MKRIFWHDFLLILREPRFLIPFILPPLFLVGMQVWLLQTNLQNGEAYEPSLLLVVGALLGTMSVTLTADSFAGERERNTLELLLCLPITLRQLFWGKLLAVMPLPIVLGLAAQAVLWALAPQIHWDWLAKAWLFSLTICLIVTGFSLLISLRSKTVRSAAQINVLVVLIILLVANLIAPFYLQWNVIPWVVFPVGVLGFALLVQGALKRFQRLF